MSAPRFRFLSDFLRSVPGHGIRLAHLRDDRHFQWDDYVSVPEDPAHYGDWYFFYYSFWRPTFRQIWIDDDTEFDVDVIDTWNMTVTPVGRHRGRFEVPLPGTSFMGIRLTRVAPTADATTAATTTATTAAATPAAPATAAAPIPAQEA